MTRPAALVLVTGLQATGKSTIAWLERMRSGPSARWEQVRRTRDSWIEPADVDVVLDSSLVEDLVIQVTGSLPG